MRDMTSLRALVVDDHALFRVAIGSLLRDQCGIASVTEASSLDEAVECLEAAPDMSLALFDLAMPGMASAASVRGIREAFPDLICIILTGSNVRRDILVALENGAHGFILKTLPPREIAAAIRYVVGGDIYVPRGLAKLDASTSLLVEDAASTDGGRAGALNRLTPRQREILNILSSGSKTNKEIGRILNLTENTVKVHVNAIFRSLKLTDRRQAYQWLEGNQLSGGLSS